MSSGEIYETLFDLLKKQKEWALLKALESHDPIDFFRDVFRQAAASLDDVSSGLNFVFLERALRDKTFRPFLQKDQKGRTVWVYRGNASEERKKALADAAKVVATEAWRLYESLPGFQMGRSYRWVAQDEKEPVDVREATLLETKKRLISAVIAWWCMTDEAEEERVFLAPLFSTTFQFQKDADLVAEVFRKMAELHTTPVPKLQRAILLMGEILQGCESGHGHWIEGLMRTFSVATARNTAPEELILVNRVLYPLHGCARGAYALASLLIDCVAGQDHAVQELIKTNSAQWTSSRDIPGTLTIEHPQIGVVIVRSKIVVCRTDFYEGYYSKALDKAKDMVDAWHAKYPAIHLCIEINIHAKYGDDVLESVSREWPATEPNC